MPRNEAMYITPDQFHKILSLEENKEYRLTYKTIWHTGQKINTVLALKYEDIDFDKDEIKLREFHGRYRTIPLQYDLKWDLSDYCKVNKIEKGDIFNYDRVTIYNNLRKLGHAIGIKERVSATTLSRTFGKLFLEKGGDLLKLQKIYGHTKPERTAEYVGLMSDQVYEQMKIETMYVNRPLSDDVCEKCGNMITERTKLTLAKEKRVIEGNLCHRCYYTEISKSRIREQRKKYLEMLGSKCVRCGYSEDWRALQVDHIKSEGVIDRKRFRGGRGGMYYYLKHPYEAKQNLQVLCANCNAIKRHEQKEWWRKKQRPTVV